jgi:hypothetical protein
MELLNGHSRVPDPPAIITHSSNICYFFLVLTKLLVGRLWHLSTATTQASFSRENKATCRIALFAFAIHFIYSQWGQYPAF